MHNTNIVYCAEKTNPRKNKYNFSWIYRNLGMIGNKAQYRILKSELKELRAEESFIKKYLKKLEKNHK